MTPVIPLQLTGVFLNKINPVFMGFFSPVTLGRGAPEFFLICKHTVLSVSWN